MEVGEVVMSAAMSLRGLKLKLIGVVWISLQRVSRPVSTR